MKRTMLLLLCACMLLPLMTACGDGSGGGGLGTVNVLGSAGTSGNGGEASGNLDVGNGNGTNGGGDDANASESPTNGNANNGTNSGSNGSNADIYDEDSVMYGGGELKVYPAYTQIPAGYAVYLDYGTDPADRDVAWESSDPSVATVTPNGMITAISAGEATITASLRDNPGVTASGVLRVVEYDESEYAQHSMLIWEDEPPSLYYQAFMYGREFTEAEAASVPEHEPGYNIPISISLDDDDDAVVGGLASGDAANDERGTMAGYLTSSPGQPRKTTRISKKDLRRKLKTNTVWSILVEGEYVNTEDDLMDNHQTFYLYVQKSGGDTPAGKYTGVSWYTMRYDYRKHFAKYPDHSQCPECWQHWWDDVFEEEKWGYYAPAAIGHGIPIEWTVFKEATITGNYTGIDNNAELFTITQWDIYEDGPFEEDPGTEYWPHPLRYKLWIDMRIDVVNNYTWVGNEPTNSGNNWGRTYSDVSGGSLRITIYAENTVMINRHFRGTLTKSIG